MKILLLNILEGCTDNDRFNKLLSFVKKNSPDVLCLLELNNWEKNDFKKLKEFKDTTKYRNHSFTKSDRGYHLGIFTNKKIIKSSYDRKNFHHALIECVISHNKTRYNFLLTHLNPHSHIERKREVEHILKKAKNKNTIVLGDLNALSPRDNYDRKKLLKTLKEKNVKKFGTLKLSTKSIQKLLQKKFFDTIKSNEEVNHTVPTNMNVDYNHCTKLRLDYIFVSKDLKRNIKEAEIIKNELTDQISDHYPINLLLK